MYHINKKQTRPSVDIEFYSMTNKNVVPEVTRLYFYNTYKKTGKCIMGDRSISSDGLVETSIFLWESKDAYQSFVNDPFMADNFAAQATYDVANNIVRETISEEEL
jgi:hypothetical protein